MRYILFNGEKNINDLATRAFRMQGNVTKAAATKAAASLLKANPRLADLSKVATGTLIAVPDDAPSITADEQAATSAAMRLVVSQTVQGVSDTLQQRLSDLETTTTSLLTAGLSRIQATNLKTSLASASGQNPELVKQLPNLDTIASDTAALTKSVQSAQNLRKQTLTQVTSVLGSFAGK
jgi:hypothetical protein